MVHFLKLFFLINLFYIINHLNLTILKAITYLPLVIIFLNNYQCYQLNLSHQYFHIINYIIFFLILIEYPKTLLKILHHNFQILFFFYANQLNPK